MASYGDARHYLNGCGWWGFLSVLLMSRAGAAHLLDSSTLTGNPRKVVAWFLLGASVAAVVNTGRLRSTGHDSHSYILNKRVSENEQTHAILRMLRYHCTTRKMGVFEANPQ